MSRSDLPTRLVLHGLVALQTLYCGWFVATQSATLPLLDEWDQLESYAHSTQEAPATPWIWQHHGDHRYPLTRWLWIESLRATGFRYYWPQFLNVAFMAAAAILSLWTIRIIRGRAHFADAILPSLLLHFGHGISWVMGYQLGFAIAIYAQVGWLWTAAHLHRGDHRMWFWLNLAYLSPIVPCGGFGVGFTPAIALWLAILWRRSGATRLQRLAVAIFGSTTVAYTAWIVGTTPDVPRDFGAAPWREPLRFSTIFAEFLGSALGVWPAGPHRSEFWLNFTLMILPLAFAVGSVATASAARSQFFPRAVLAVLLGLFLVAAATALRRPGAYLDRYAAFGAVGLIALACWWLPKCTMRESRWSTVIGGSIALAVAVGMFLLNFDAGKYEAFRFRAGDRKLHDDILAGLSPEVIAGRHGGLLRVSRGDSFAGQLAVLRDAGIPPFDRVGANWKVRFVPFEPSPDRRFPTPPANAIGVRCSCTSTGPTYGTTIRLLGRIHGREEQELDVACPLYNPGAMHLVWLIPPHASGLVVVPSAPNLAVELAEFEWIVPE